MLAPDLHSFCPSTTHSTLISQCLSSSQHPGLGRGYRGYIPRAEWLRQVGAGLKLWLP